MNETRDADTSGVDQDRAAGLDTRPNWS